MADTPQQTTSSPLQSSSVLGEAREGLYSMARSYIKDATQLHAMQQSASQPAQGSAPRFPTFLKEVERVANDAVTYAANGDIEEAHKRRAWLDQKLADPVVKQALVDVANAGIDGYSQRADRFASGMWTREIVQATRTGAPLSESALQTKYGMAVGSSMARIQRGVGTPEDVRLVNAVQEGGVAAQKPITRTDHSTGNQMVVGFQPDLETGYEIFRSTDALVTTTFGLSPAHQDFGTLTQSSRKTMEYVNAIARPGEAPALRKTLADKVSAFAGPNATPERKVAEWNGMAQVLGELAAKAKTDPNSQAYLNEYLNGLPENLTRDQFLQDVKPGFDRFLQVRKATQDVQKQWDLLLSMAPSQDLPPNWNPVDPKEAIRYSLQGDNDPSKTSPIEAQLEAAKDIKRHQERVKNYSMGYTGKLNTDGTRQVASGLQQAAGRAYEAVFASVAAAKAMGRSDLGPTILQSGVDKFKKELSGLGVTREAIDAMGDEGVLAILGQTLDVYAVGSGKEPTLSDVKTLDKFLYKNFESTDAALQRVTQELEAAGKNPGSMPVARRIELSLAQKRLGEARALEQIGTSQLSGEAEKEIERIRNLPAPERKMFFDDFTQVKIRVKSDVDLELKKFTDDKGEKVTYDSRDGFFSGGKSRRAFRRAVENSLAGLAVDKKIVEALVASSDGQPLEIVKKRIEDIIETHAVEGRVTLAIDTEQDGDRYYFDPVSSEPSPVAVPKSVIVGLRYAAGEPGARQVVQETQKAIVRTKQESVTAGVLREVAAVDPNSAMLMLKSIPGMDVNKTTILGGLMQAAHDSSEPDVRKTALDQYIKIVEADAKGDNVKRENAAEHRLLIEAYGKAEPGSAAQEAFANLIEERYGKGARPKATAPVPGVKKAASATPEDEE